MEPIASRQELLELLSVVARRGNVPAMRLLLDELRLEQANADAAALIGEA